jgi:hypothetical protein
LVLALSYGASAAGIASNPAIAALGLDTAGVERMLETLFTQVPGLRRYHWNAVAWGIQRGYVESLWGFPRPAHDLLSPFLNLRSSTVRAMENHVIQSFAAQVLDAAMVWADQILVELGLEEEIQMVLQVHDEVDSVVDEDHMQITKALFEHCLGNVVDLGATCSVDVEVGKHDGFASRWGDLVKFNDIDYGPQTPKTAEIIANIQARKSPFLDMPLAQMATPFDITQVPDKDLSIYLWHAAHLNFPTNDPRLSALNTYKPVGYLVNVRSRTTKAGKTMYSGTLACRDGYLDVVSFTDPLVEGQAALSGKYQAERNSFIVSELTPLSALNTHRANLRMGTSNSTWDFAGLRRAIDALHPTA